MKAFKTYLCFLRFLFMNIPFNVCCPHTSTIHFCHQPSQVCIQGQTTTVSLEGVPHKLSQFHLVSWQISTSRNGELFSRTSLVKKLSSFWCDFIFIDFPRSFLWNVPWCNISLVLLNLPQWIRMMYCAPRQLNIHNTHTPAVSPECGKPPIDTRCL